ncbi:MAG: hypothetical protein ACRD5G_04650 [Candidatus Acidiferrales bacterium]
MPIRTPTRTSGASDGTGKTDLDFIQVGTTSREEVVQKLGWTDTGIKDERLFVGRWVSSSSGLFGVGGGDFDRHWGGRNLLIEFDEKGVVKQYSVFGDKELVKQLSAWVTQRPDRLLDLSRPIEIQVKHYRRRGHSSDKGALVFAEDSFEFREDLGTSHNFKISPTKISQLSFSGLVDKAPLGQKPPDPRHISLTLHFTEKTTVGKKMTLHMNVPAIMSLVKYLAQTRSR